MKPDWKDAPEWAKYLAMDSDESWWWHEFNPHMKRKCWSGHKSKTALASPANDKWKYTKEPRP